MAGAWWKVKCSQIYWPDKQTVSVKWNTYFDKTIASVQHLEGEDWKFVKSQTDLPSTSKAFKPPDTINSIPTTNNQSSEQELPSKSKILQKRIRKPTQRLKDLLKGRAVSSDRPSAPQIPVGMQLPTKRAEDVVLEGEETANWMMSASFIEEYAMAVDTGEMEALESCSLAEAVRATEVEA